MKRRWWILIILILIVLAIFLLFRLGTRSGVTDAQVSEALPGDAIIPHPWITIDRAAVMPASASTTWPWVEQLGKDRAGWYAPLWLENLLKEHSATTVEPQYQNLQVGDVIPDWGGGSLKVLALQPGQYVVYGSLHAPTNASSTEGMTNYAFTWTLILEDSTSTSTVFHLRLRITPPTTWQRYLPAAPLGIIDYATDVVMLDGLQQKLRPNL
jgi:hypothetical protein